MIIPVKKLKNGFEIPTLGLGTWLIGGDKVRNPQNNDPTDIKAIEQVVSMGITHIDTAENYAEGHTEEIVGQAIKNFKRESLFLVSKVDKTHLGYDNLLSSCQKSLERLQTNYLDLYLIHAPNDEIPEEETLRALDKLLKQGLIKNIGVSNFKTERLIRFQKQTNHKLVVNQVYYNLVIREPEKDGLLDYCQNNDTILTAYRPIEQNKLPESQFLRDLARKYGKTPIQIALNWLVSQENVIVIPKMLSPDHVKENLGALNWKMDKEDIELLRRDFPGQQEKSGILPLR